MKILRLDKEMLSKDKHTIREYFELDSKDKDNEIYRVLVPIVPDTSYLSNVIETFVESKNNVVNQISSKYSFHCANHNIVDYINDAVIYGKNNESYRIFEQPIPMGEMA